MRRSAGWIHRRGADRGWRVTREGEDGQFRRRPARASSSSSAEVGRSDRDRKPPPLSACGPRRSRRPPRGRAGTPSRATSSASALLGVDVRYMCERELVRGGGWAATECLLALTTAAATKTDVRPRRCESAAPEGPPGGSVREDRSAARGGRGKRMGRRRRGRVVEDAGGDVFDDDDEFHRASGFLRRGRAAASTRRARPSNPPSTRARGARGLAARAGLSGWPRGATRLDVEAGRRAFGRGEFFRRGDGGGGGRRRRPCRLDAPRPPGHRRGESRLLERLHPRGARPGGDAVREETREAVDGTGSHPTAQSTAPSTTPGRFSPRGVGARRRESLAARKRDSFDARRRGGRGGASASGRRVSRDEGDDGAMRGEMREMETRVARVAVARAGG